MVALNDSVAELNSYVRASGMSVNVVEDLYVTEQVMSGLRLDLPSCRQRRTPGLCVVSCCHLCFLLSVDFTRVVLNEWKSALW